MIILLLSAAMLVVDGIGYRAVIGDPSWYDVGRVYDVEPRLTPDREDLVLAFDVRGAVTLGIHAAPAHRLPLYEGPTRGRVGVSDGCINLRPADFRSVSQGVLSAASAGRPVRMMVMP